MDNPILVVAYNLKEFRKYILELALTPDNFEKAMSLSPPRARVGGKEYFYVSSANDLRGYHRATIRFIGDAKYRQDYEEIREHVLTRGFGIE